MSKQIDAMTRAILLFEVNNQWLAERYNAPPSTTAIRVVGELHEAVAEQSAQEAELRRLHEVNQELLGALKMGVAETLDYIKLNHLTGAENNQWIVWAQAAIAKATKGNT